MADSDFDLPKLRTTLLALVVRWLTAEEIQREIVAARERAGDDPPHVPIQIVQQTLAQLVEQGAVTEKRAKDKPTAYRVNRDALIGRRARMLVTLAAQNDLSELEPKLLESCGASRADLDALVDGRLIAVSGSGLVELASGAHDELVSRGALAVLGEDIPSDVDDKAVGEDFARKAIKQAEALTAEARAWESKFNRLALWLKARGVQDIEGIVEPPAPKPLRTTIEHIETRKIDAAEKGAILAEILKLDEARALVQLRLDGWKSQGKADLEKIDAEIAALKSAAQSSERTVSTLAYKELDWAEKVTLIRAVDDDRILKKEPIPKGTQKPLGAGAKANGAGKHAEAPAEGAPIEDKGDPGDARPKLTDVGGAALAELQGSAEPLTLEQLAVRIGERYQGVPEGGGVLGLLKPELHQLVRAKRIAKDKASGGYSLVPVADAAAPAEAESGGEGEPGPLASAERRRQGKKKANGLDSIEQPYAEPRPS